MNPKVFYNVGYRVARMPWEIGPRTELVSLVTSGRLRFAAYLMRREA
ncbi:hypothetical protein [Nonomuraea sediminis]|nr:hypothetical protein [Nonomuraea sediminis]